jgi:putative oxidoreductase
MRSSLTSWSPYLLSMLRIVSALLFVEHGSAKLLGIPHQDMAKHPFEIFSMMGFSGVLELVGGFLLVVGLFTRFTAFILSGEMAVAYFMVHAPNGFFPLVNKGELAVLYCFVFLYFVFSGGGPWSLDHLRHRS